MFKANEKNVPVQIEEEKKMTVEFLVKKILLHSKRVCCLINLSAELLKAVCSVRFLINLPVYLAYIVIVVVVFTVAVFATWSGVLFNNIYLHCTINYK